MLNSPNRMRAACATLAAALATASCHNLQMTKYSSGDAGSIDIYSGRSPVALANVSQREDGVALIIFATKMKPGVHAVHMHYGCNSGTAPVGEGLLANIEVDANGIGKLETVIKGAVLEELMDKTLVVHTNKGYRFSNPEMGVGGVVGCGRFDQESRLVAGSHGG